LKGANIPSFCDNVKESVPSKERCPQDSYVIIPEQCTMYDQQLLKIQESPEMIPTGEIPRSLKVVVDRNLVDKLSPGTRVTITGIYTVAENKFISQKIGTGQMKTPYMLTLGLEIETFGTRKYEARFTQEDREKFHEMSKNPMIV